MNFFGPGSPYLNHPLLTPERSAAEVAQLAAALELEPGARVLDVGCGFGRHVEAFSAAGYEAVGVDPSQAMIDAARSRCPAATLVVGTVDDVDAAEPFGVAVMMFTTLGQVDESGRDNTAMLTRIHELVRPGGVVVIEVPQRDAAVAALVADDGFTDGPTSLTIRRRYDPTTQRVAERFERVADGEREVFDLEYRLFAVEELRVLLADAGFDPVDIFASIDGSPLTAEAATMVAFARR